ncbi:MAG: tetratricopeptide repeat protein [Candidatus Tectomicrobia bacterium]|uniref:Tetratricopeptide repeat protein n=1 Tax=Tectimicrobiota bacterium TaxID=2528274 RepID=A0A937VXH8_UNCTE|nr:tetratricopeptide repeat protein [Candidatus Tectomicrobia bacterium]
MPALLLTLLLSVTVPATVLAHPPMQELVQRTLGLIYNMAFDEALQAAQHITDTVPTHPAGPFLRASTYWQRRLVVYESQQRASLLTQFLAATEQARARAAQLPPAQATEADFYLGAVYGMQARMYFVEQYYLRALLTARQGSVHLQACVARDPAWYDAYAGLGTYHYVLSRVPDFWRPLVQRLIGLPGDREQGLQALEQARTAGQLSAPEATSLLAKIYALPEEQQYDRAAHLLEHLVQRYPQNTDYRYRLALVCIQLRRWERARALLQALLTDVEQARPYTPREWIPFLQYRLAELALMQRQPHAAAVFLHTLRTQTLSPALRAWVELRLGNMHDLLGEGQAAQAWYQGVQGEAEAEAQAQQYRHMPFNGLTIALKPPEQVVI